MFDFRKFTNWLSGGLLDSRPTWETYKASEFDWKTTARQFTAPLVIFWALSALVLGWLFGNGQGFAGFISTVLASLLWFGLGSFIASVLAKKFAGTESVDRALSALTFASLPGVVGTIGQTLPYIGWILWIGGAIWSIMLLWQALPAFLDIPLERRTGHFFATLGLFFPAAIVLGFLLGSMGLFGGFSGGGSSYDSWDSSGDRQVRTEFRRSSNQGNDGDREDRRRTSNDSSDSGAGIFGFGREVDYLAEAEEDRYSPPEDGLIDEQQIERITRFFAAADRLRNASTEAFEKFEGNGDQQPSLGDFFKGVKGLVSASTAEMQAVKSGGGNWAEHEWVKRQLFEARLHEDLNDTTAHNFELYQKYEAQLKDWL